MKSQHLFLGGLLVAVLIGLVFIGISFNKNQTTSKSLESRKGEIPPYYMWYSQDELVKAQEKGRAVIYFWAVWCPTCQALDKELKERSQELPSDVTILKTNYDTEKELKRKYQIIQQHTLVQVDKNGNEVKKWIGGNIDVIKQELR